MAGELQDAVRRLCGSRAMASSPVGGSVYEVGLEDGRTLVAKRYGEANGVKAEAFSLRWLAEPSSVAIPTVYGFDDTWLLTEYVPPGRPSKEAAESFGRGLAELHAAGAKAFGSPPAGGPEQATIGMAPMRNIECDGWSEFYSRHRVEPYLREALDRGLLPRSGAAVLEEVVDGIESLAGPPEPPARLHGDLWSGNVHWGADGRAWVIDPAAHGGHRETDLAMLQLFGCPHLETILGAYDEHAPLADGWRERVSLHQLFPLLVHTVLFGGSYGHQTVAAARSALQARS